ncbi:LysR family transcriptional regulator [Brevibacillus sp. SYP-B805]|uniref:LysR family transcriptional regulator n=1 Tax=Brevibacillus sp. SYP-B805 TaxID=1578199 RepID=UPI0013EB3673|nr:LysR family transcriptional regulator [Brevibacillus sp. SYP-B805]NGQ96269.1 LysR family transcriptional regulator [Brevibacillus sp. SYP-B805]
MELLQLQYFQTVARLEHMTKAAQELHISQPALSKTIARLEEELGVPLFDRQSRQIRLNTFGKAFLQKVETALAVLEEGRREVADLAGMERGSIHLATNALNRISNALGAFRSLHPDVNFRIIQVAPASLEEMVQLLEKGEIDLCFTAAPFDRPGICEMPVLNAEVFLAVPPGHRLEGRHSICLHEVADEPFIEYKAGHPFRKMNEAFCKKAGIRPKVVCEVEEPAALGSLVLAGLGVAFVPACKRDESPLTLLRIDDPDCRRVFTIAWHEKRYLSTAARAFQQFLEKYFIDLQQPLLG